MSKMSDLMLSIEELYFKGFSVTKTAEALGISEDLVMDAFDAIEDTEVNGERDYDDSMDGDAASALASCGWGTDEDYGDYGSEY